MYRSVIGKADADDVTAGDVIFMGETKIELDEKNPNDLEVSIAPVEGESVMVLTPEKIKELQKHIYGKWQSGKNFWLIEAADKGISLVSGDQYVDVDAIGVVPFSKTALPVKVTVMREDGTEFTMRNAYLDGLRIKTDHKLDSDDKQDVDDLPEWVIDEALDKWFPGEWFDLKFIPAPNPRDMVAEVDMWRMHVTYTEGDMFGGQRIKELHDPYIAESFMLSRHHEVEKIPITLQFVDANNRPYTEDLPYGDTVRVEAKFKEAPQEDMRDVQLSWDGKGLSVDWVQVKRSGTDKKIYYSAPFILEDAGAQAAMPDSSSLTGNMKL